MGTVNTLRSICLGFGLCLIGANPSAATERLTVADFAADGLSHFSEKSFEGHTDYSLIKDEGQTVLKAETQAQASALYREMEIDLTATPMLSWRWRIENTHPITEPETKSGDDFPARVYVVVREGFFPWQTRALNYVWANSQVEKTYWPNPFTKKAVMIPLRFGQQDVGVWQSEKVDVAADFYRIFGRRIQQADGVAIMTDGDNSGGQVTAYYGDIFFSAE